MCPRTFTSYAWANKHEQIAHSTTLNTTIKNRDAVTSRNPKTKYSPSPIKSVPQSVLPLFPHQFNRKSNVGSPQERSQMERSNCRNTGPQTIGASKYATECHKFQNQKLPQPYFDTAERYQEREPEMPKKRNYNTAFSDRGDQFVDQGSSINFPGSLHRKQEDALILQASHIILIILTPFS